MVKTNRSVQKSGLRAKQGQTGKGAHYITRQKALRKLQLPLKDFRRLCILKGIFPREAPRGKDKAKVYYHVKDIHFLSHERLIQKYRDLKVFLRKRARYHGRYEHDEAKKLAKPTFKVDHLVRERYPTMADALRDLDDPLSMLFLFNTLRVKVHAAFTETDASMAQRLIAEWKLLIQKQHALRKVFVSIKGYYYQAQVQGQTVTWLVPHQAMQNTPQTVDYDVMTTFLQFYLAMVRCINFRLYKENGAVYPPIIVTEETIAQQFFEDNVKTAVPSTKTVKKVSVDVHEKIKKNTLSNKVVSSALKSEAVEDSDDDMVDNEDDQTSKFQQLDPSLQLIDEDSEKSKATFVGCTFLVGRECAFDPLAFVIRAAGGVAIRESVITSTFSNSPLFTHQVMDRPLTTNFKPIVNRKYIQPQWIFDSFNMRQTLPIEPYAPGSILPPHLSPFVDDLKENYVPEQRNQLRAWVGLPPLKQSVLSRIEKEAQKSTEQTEEQQEAEYLAELAQERKKLNSKQSNKLIPVEQRDIDIDLGDDMTISDDDDDDNDDIQVSDVSDSEFDENEYMNDNDEDEESEIDIEEKKVAAKAKPAPKPNAFNPRDNDKQLAKIMMNKKDKRLHNRMMFGINANKKNAAILAEKRDAAKTGEQPQLPQIGSKLRRKR